MNKGLITKKGFLSPFQQPLTAVVARSRRLDEWRNQGKRDPQGYVGTSCATASAPTPRCSA
jgi:hypothetical protein